MTYETPMLTGAVHEGLLWAVVRDLQAVIHLESVNPPGNEMQVARFLHDALHRHGVESHLFEPAPGRGAVIARVRGTGAARPVLLMAHMDVVGVEREKWSTPPFGGEMLDGYVYGRGAIDDKGMLITNLHTVLWLQSQVAAGNRPSRDVIFLATSDEEAGGDYGIDWVMANHRDLIDAEYALNEGGRVRIVDGRPIYAAVQCAEKVPHNVIVTALGSGGHAAIPHEGNAITRLSRALARITDHREPLALFDITRGFFGRLATVWPQADLRAAMSDLASGNSTREAAGAQVLQAIPSFDAVLRTGISPTLISGGIRTNVIPTEAQATLNVRVMPGASLHELLERLRAVVDDPFIDFTVKSRGREAPASPAFGAMWDAIATTLHELAPSMAVAPYLSTSATDSAALREAGIPCYGLLPFPLTLEDEDRMHGHDERVSVESLAFGVALSCGIVGRLTSRTR